MKAKKCPSEERNLMSSLRKTNTRILLKFRSLDFRCDCTMEYLNLLYEKVRNKLEQILPKGTKKWRELELRKCNSRYSMDGNVAFE